MFILTRWIKLAVAALVVRIFWGAPWPLAVPAYWCAGWITVNVFVESLEDLCGIERNDR